VARGSPSGNLLRKNLRFRLREFEAQQPLAGNAVATGFGGLKFPAACGLQGQIGKKLAGSGRIELGGRYVSSGVDVHADGDADFSMNGVTRFL